MKEYAFAMYLLASLVIAVRQVEDPANEKYATFAFFFYLLLWPAFAVASWGCSQLKVEEAPKKERGPQ